MAWSFRIGRLLGSDLRVHATFFLLIAWIGASGYIAGGWALAAESVAFVAALFACVLAHEFGHALMARRYGIATPDITLLPIGGLARLERLPEEPGREIAVALAGPAVNIAIWAVLAGVSGARLSDLADPEAGFVARLATLNLFLAVFNLLPAFPMDGGRVFRALLARQMGRVRATRRAAQTGQAVAVVLGLAGLAAGNPVLVLIAAFVFIAGNAEAQEVALRNLARMMPARAAMITRFEPLAPDDSLAAAEAALIRTTQHEFPVLKADGRLAGLLTRTALLAAHAAQAHAARARSGGPPPRVADLMAREIPAVGLGAPLDAALDALHAGAPAVAVADAEGRFLGYITRENLGELMILSDREG